MGAKVPIEFKPIFSLLSRSTYHDERVHEVDGKEKFGLNLMPAKVGIKPEGKNSSLSG